MLTKIEKYCRKLISLIRFCFIGRFKSVIYIDTPIHGNLGDQAIVLATVQMIKKVLNAEHVYEITAEDIGGLEGIYAFLARNGQVILIHGGGFLGTIWPREEIRFRNIVKAFEKNKIIVFPQTVYFELKTKYGEKMLQESVEIYSKHPNMKLFVREKYSYDFVKKHFPKVTVFLVPDIVTLMKYEQDCLSERNGVLLCIRRDKEKILSEQMKCNIVNVLKRHFNDITWTDTVVPYKIFPKRRNREVYAKLKQFASAKLIVTDRLHGMLFAAITASPCIALDNQSNKVKGVYEWVKNNKYIRFIDNVEEFEVTLNEMELNKKYIYNRENEKQNFELLLTELRKC